jgi:hypothetical protein
MPSATLNQSTGTLPVRGVAAKSGRALYAGIFVRVRVPVDQVQERAVRADVAHRQRQAGPLFVVVNGENIVEQRKVRGRAAGRRAARHRGWPEGGRPRHHRRACCGRFPARRSIRRLKTIEAQPASAK